MALPPLRSLLPRSLFGRALTILLVPIAVLQLVVGLVFFQRHYLRVSEQMTRAIAYELAYSVEQRVRDFGVRRALGATTGEVLRVVVTGAVPMIVAGTVIGLGLSAAAGRLLTSLLFEVRPLDAATFAAVVVVIALTAAASMIAPAWRAARIDPAMALRTE